MKPKEYLLKHGHITHIGRGRMSAEHIAIIKKAVAAGENIEGYSVARPSTAAPVPQSEDSQVVRESRSDSIPDVPEESRPEKDWTAYRHEDGKQVEIGMRTVCNNCNSSLTYCRCNRPVVWVDYDSETVVYFKPRTSPQVRK